MLSVLINQPLYYSPFNGNYFNVEIVLIQSGSKVKSYSNKCQTLAHYLNTYSSLFTQMCEVLELSVGTQ